MSKLTYDYVIIGGGIYGLRLAKLLSQKYNTSNIIVFEKNKKMSYLKENPHFEILDTGYELDPKLKKQKLVLEGRERLIAYCKENNLEYKQKDQLIFASSVEDRYNMIKFLRESSYNKATIKKIDVKEARSIEPELYDSIMKYDIYHLKESGIIDKQGLRRALLKEAQLTGVEIKFETLIKSIEFEGTRFRLHFDSNDENFAYANKIINVAGENSFDFAEKLNHVKNIECTKLIHNYHIHKKPKRTPNIILSFLPTLLHPGLTLYPDNDDKLIFGPSVEPYHFFKLSGIFQRTRKLFHLLSKLKQNEYDIYDDIDKSKFNYQFKLFAKMFDFVYSPSNIKMNNEFRYCDILLNTKTKEIEKDFMFVNGFHRDINNETMSLHMLNLNKYGLHSLFSSCDEAITLI